MKVGVLHSCGGSEIMTKRTDASGDGQEKGIEIKVITCLGLKASL